MSDDQRSALINLGISDATLQNLAAAKNGTTSGMGVLKDPFEVPQQLVLVGTMPDTATETNFFIDDAVGLAGAFGLVGTNTGIEFTSTNSITPAIIKEYLKTHALIMGGYNFESSSSSQLSSNLKAIYSSLDGNNKSKQLFSAQSVSNMQNNPNLLNVNQPFVYTNATALRIPATALGTGNGNLVFTFTFKIIGAVPYGKLAEFLDAAQIPERSKLNC